MAQHTLTIQCASDAYVDSANPNTNYGTGSQLKVHGNLPNILSSILYFDSSALPVHKRIASAFFYMYLESIDGASSGVIAALTSVTSILAETSITYNNLPTQAAYSPQNHGNAWLESLAGKALSFVHADIINQLISAYAASRSKLWLNIYDANADSSIKVFTSREGTNKPYITIIYEDVPPDAPTPVDPIGAFKDNTSVIRFSWTYNSAVGGVQKAFDLQWSTDQVTWTTVSQTTSNNYYDIPANTLPSGNIYWRVRCYNEYDEVSAYSSVSSIYAIGAPATPIIQSITAGTARPTVAWSASSQQQIYELQILQGATVVYESGYQPGILTRSHKVKAFLLDGNYTVKVRIKNEYDLYSSWGESAFTVTTSKPAKPTFTMQTSAYGLEFRVTGIPAGGYALLYRSRYDENSYTCIGKILPATPEFQDNTVCNSVEYKYFVRVVSATETYQDSDVKFGQADFKYSLVASVSNPADAFVFNRSLNAPPKRSYERNINTEGVFYSGREYPVFEPSENISSGLSLSFYLSTYEAVEEFIAFYDLKETILYRDIRGRKIYGTLSGLSVSDERKGYTINFVVNQSDYIEELEV